MKVKEEQLEVRMLIGKGLQLADHFPSSWVCEIQKEMEDRAILASRGEDVTRRACSNVETLACSAQSLQAWSRLPSTAQACLGPKKH